MTDNSDAIQAVRRMQDFIERHIGEVITLHMLAEAAGYSPWYAARIFRDITGKTPFDYIRSLRLSRAAVRLGEGKSKVVDVALDFVFGTHEGFTRAFSREFGMTPRDYLKNRPSLKLFIPEPVRDDYLRILKRGVTDMNTQTNANTIFVQVVERPARKVILKRARKADGYFGYCEELGCDIFETLAGVKDALYEPIGMWLPENLRPVGTSEYVMGVEMPSEYVGPVPDGFELADLPPCNMMVFQGQPYDDSQFMQAISDLWALMKTYNPEIYGFRWANEDGPRFQMEPQGYRGYIEGRPVRPVNKE